MGGSCHGRISREEKFDNEMNRERDILGTGSTSEETGPDGPPQL